MSIQIFYDGDCPFCNQYVRMLRLRDAHGTPQLVDLRLNPTEHEQLRARGFNCDQGMVVRVGDQFYEGSQALHVLSGLSSSLTWLSRVSGILFSSSRVASWVYPVLRSARNATLFVLGRQRLNSEEINNLAPFFLFNGAWGLFAFLHSISYVFFPYGSHVYLTTILIGILGIALLLKPEDMRVFCGLLLVLIVDAWLQMPLNSNHTIIKNFLLLAMLIGGARQLWRGGTWSDFYADFAPVGRVLLVVMYVFGIFHKLNRDFLDPMVSCAVVLWRAMPAPLGYLDSTPVHLATIYGTFLAEGLILLLLLLRRTRHWGIAVGIAFHSLLALSSYAMYVQFSMLTIALHMLFVERHDAARIQSLPAWQRLQAALHTTRGYLVLSVWLGLMIFLGRNSGYSEISILWMPSVLLLAWLCLKVRHDARNSEGALHQLRSPALLANVLSVLFFLNCAAPYLGLKTSQSISMFANLQLEGGQSNHLVFTDPPGPFGYMADVVTITAASGSPVLDYVRTEGLRVTYYYLLDKLERNPNLVVSFERKGLTFAHQNAASLADEVERVLHPRWFRNWFHFSVVDMSSPKPCALDR